MWSDVLVERELETTWLIAQTDPTVKAATNPDLFRLLPSIDELLRNPQLQALVQRFGHAATVEASRSFIEELRVAIAGGTVDEARIKTAIDRLPKGIEERLQAGLSYSLRPVINATGVILHTNLGRAPLSQTALQHVTEISQGYSNLEFDLATGERGKRDVHVSRLFAQLLNSAGARSLDHCCQQQRRRGAAGSQRIGRGRGSDRVARRTGRDRRLVSHS